MVNTNDNKRFTPPAEESWWLVRNYATGLEVYSKAKTAYFAVEKARFPNGDCCGWVLSQCDVKLILEPSEVVEIMKQMG